MLGKIGAKQVRAWWFDPRTGKATQIREVAGKGTQEFTPSGTPDAATIGSWCSTTRHASSLRRRYPDGMKTLLLALVSGVTALHAQPEGIWQGYDGEWGHVSRQLIALAEATPAEQFTWRPAPGSPIR